MNQLKYLVTVSALSLTAVSCGQNSGFSRSQSEQSEEDQYAYDPAKPDFILPEGETAYEFRKASTSLAGLTAKAHQEQIRVCMSDSSNSEARKDLIEGVILKWFEPLREISSKPIVSRVDIVSWNSSGCDVYVAVGNYNPAMTSLGKTPRVNIAKSGWYGSSTVTLHEFGHAFGLLDTYNGRGGSCQRGQPGSVMCYAKYNDLLEDDILGVQAVYKAVFPK